MSSFFTRPASERKRKHASSEASPTKRRRYDTATASSKPKTKKIQRDRSISESESDDNDELGATILSEVTSDASGNEGETGAERRIRLAQQYLDDIKTEVQDIGFDAADVDKDLIAERLNEDIAESKGRLYRHVASTYDYASASVMRFHGYGHCTTSIAACPPYVYTVTKDLTITKWELPVARLCQRPLTTDRTISKFPQSIRQRPTKLLSTHGSRYESGSSSYSHHTDSILCVASSADGRFVATGGMDKRIIIWDASTLQALRVFTQHRDSVTSLAFRRGTNQLYSSSADRTIKSWSLNELAYVETLFGHQDQVVDIAALAQERCLSAGARDRTVRLWKVIEETQLVFRGGGVPKEKKHGQGRLEKDPRAFAEGSIDRVALIDDETFVTGSDNGTLALWSIHKKKPVFLVPTAHGQDPPPKLEQSFAEKDLAGRKAPAPPRPRWITALKTVPYSDLVLSGSWDGWIRAWMVTPDRKRIELLAVVGGTEKWGESCDGNSENNDHTGRTEATDKPISHGFINDLDVFEWGEGGKDGLCIVAALGKEHRLGRWKKIAGSNGAIVFEVPKKCNNGHQG